VFVRSSVLALGLQAGVSSALAVCVGGVCPLPGTPVAVYAQYQPPSSTAAGAQFAAYQSTMVQPLPVFQREPHPWTRAKPVPDPETLSPQTRLFFEIADLQASNLIAPGAQHVRRSEFHNSVDSHGNTYNAYSTLRHISLPLALTSAVIVLLASSLGLSFLVGRRVEQFAVPAPAPLPDPSGVQEQSKADGDAVHVIEWEDASASPSTECTWDSLVRTCAGDVMAAAAAIKAQVDVDPELNPTSPEAFRRAIEALQPKPIAETT